MPNEMAPAFATSLALPLHLPLSCFQKFKMDLKKTANNSPNLPCQAIS